MGKGFYGESIIFGNGYFGKRKFWERDIYGHSEKKSFRAFWEKDIPGNEPFGRGTFWEKGYNNYGK